MHRHRSHCKSRQQRGVRDIDRKIRSDLAQAWGGIDGGGWWAAAAGVKRLSCDPFLSLRYFKILIHHLPKT